MKRVCIVTPIYQLPLSSDEEVSVDHASYFLSGYDRIIVAPRSLSIPERYVAGRRLLRFADSYFTGLDGYNRLLLSRRFYNSFRDYEYILIYQLDCLVFAAELENWCAKGWDYVGAPWFKGHRDDTSDGLWAVGNGGLSLRRVSKFLEVLSSRKRLTVPSLKGETRFFSDSPRFQRIFLRLKALAYAAGYKNNVRYLVKEFGGYEDLFWSFLASQFVSSYIIPSPVEALSFAFEYAPRFCFEANGSKLPFGCHGWYKIDPDFWRPFLLKPGLTATS